MLFYIYLIISGEGIDLESVPRQTFDDDDLYGDVILSQNSHSLSSQEIILQLEKDKITFLTVTREKDLSQMDTCEFWKTHRSDMPLLSDLARKLLCILSSSACIERFFSICGVICTNMRGNMSPDMVRKRSIIKLNLDLIDDYLENEL